jgi:hypothetical protein
MFRLLALACNTKNLGFAISKRFISIYNALGLTEPHFHAASIGNKNQRGSLLYVPYVLFHLTSEHSSPIASSNLMAGAGMLSVKESMIHFTRILCLLLELHLVCSSPLADFF